MSHSSSQHQPITRKTADMNYSLINTDGGQELAAGILGLDDARKAGASTAQDIGEDVEIVDEGGNTVETVECETAHHDV